MAGTANRIRGRVKSRVRVRVRGRVRSRVRPMLGRRPAHHVGVNLMLALRIALVACT